MQLRPNTHTLTLNTASGTRQRGGHGTNVSIPKQISSYWKLTKSQQRRRPWYPSCGPHPTFQPKLLPSEHVSLYLRGPDPLTVPFQPTHGFWTLSSRKTTQDKHFSRVGLQRKKNLTLINLPSGTTDTSSKCQEWLQSTFEKRESRPHFKHPKDKQPNSTRAPTPARASMKLPQTEKHTDMYTDDEDGSKGQLSLEHCLLFM